MSMLFRPAVAAAVCLAPSMLLGADAGLLKYVGPDARELAGVYVSRVVNSPLGQFVQSQAGDDRPELEEFVELTGFDPRRDLHEFVVATAGGEGKRPKPGLVVGRGAFDRNRIAAAAASAKVSKETYSGVDLFRSPSGQQWFAFPEPSILLAGEENMVKSALDRRGAAAPFDARLTAKIHAASALYDVWFAAVEPAAVRFGKTRLPQTNVDVVSGGLRFGSKVELNAEAVMKTEKDAESLVQVIQFVQGIAQMQRGRNPQMAHIFDLLQNSRTTLTGSTVLFSASATEEEIEKLVRRRPAKAAAVVQ